LQSAESNDVGGVLDWDDGQIATLRSVYGVTHLLVAQARVDVSLRKHDSAADRLLKLVYPQSASERSTYVVYEINSTAPADR
jgi:hypothetical protein